MRKIAMRCISLMLALIMILMPAPALAQGEGDQQFGLQGKNFQDLDLSHLDLSSGQKAEVEDPGEVEETKNVEKAPEKEGAEAGQAKQPAMLAGPAPRARASATPPVGPIPGEELKELASWEDLKAELEYSGEDGVYPQNNFKVKRLLLKNKKYKLTGDITIDMNDPFFEGKDEFVNNGILSAGYLWQTSESVPGGYKYHDHWLIDNFDFDGNGHKITILPKSGQAAPALFGGVYAEKLHIHGLDLTVKGDSLGYPFIEVVKSSKGKDEEGLSYVNGLIDDIDVEVKGSVLPWTYFKNDGKRPWLTQNNHASGAFLGSIATGFGIKTISVNLEGVRVKVDGNIGSDKVYSLTQEDKALLKRGVSYSAASLGFLWFSEGANVLDRDSASYKKLFTDKDDSVVRNCGYMENIDVTVGGSILATGYENAHAAGFMDSSDEVWLDKINIDVAGDIRSTLAGGKEGHNPYGNYSQQTSYAVGFCESLTHLTNSSLKANRIAMKIAQDYKTKSDNGNRQNEVTKLMGIGYGSGKGSLIKVVGNTVNIKEGLEAETPIHLIACAGFYNSWNSYGKHGVDWAQFFEKNTIHLGPTKLVGTGDHDIQYYGLAKKFRTGYLDQDHKDRGHSPLDEVSAKENRLSVDRLEMINRGGDVAVNPTFLNAANAKKNTISYGDIRVYARGGRYTGLGHLENTEPSEDNGIQEITENNELKFKNITIAGINFDRVSLMAGTIKPGKTLKNNRIEVGKVQVQLLGHDGQGQITAINPSPLYMGGLANINHGSSEGNRLFMKELFLLNSNVTYFGLGAAFSRDAVEKDNSILVDGSYEVRSILDLFGGGYVGYSTGDKGSSYTNNHIQVNGFAKAATFVDQDKKPLGIAYFGAFGGWLVNGKVKDSSTLFFNGYLPFSYRMDGGELNHVAHYSDEGNWEAPDLGFAGLLKEIVNDHKVTIKNSTYLVDKVYQGPGRDGQGEVDKNNEDSVVYKDSDVTGESGNNYIVIVGGSSPESPFNRTAYPLAKRMSTEKEMGNTTTEVWAKSGQPVGKLNIDSRSFQDKYWGDKAGEYQVGEAEKKFAYMNQNPDNLSLKFLGTDADRIKEGGRIGELTDYRHRHAGLYVENGPIYDLLGIKGSPAMYKLSYTFQSITPGKELPEAVKDLLKEDRFKASYVEGKKAFTPPMPSKTEVKVEGGSWQFVKWVPEKTEGLDKDLTFVGQWKFVKEVKPNPPTPPTPPTPKPDNPKDIDRIDGDDRKDTANKVSKKYFDQSETVIVVDSDNYPDALTASVLAKVLDCPILLNNTDFLEDEVRDEILRLGAKDIIICGGNEAISDQVKEELEAIDQDEVERIWGHDRYDTAEQVARKIAKLLGGVNKAVIASGEVFPDALSAAPLAGMENAPILLAKRKSLKESVATCIEDLNIRKVYISGGNVRLDRSLEEVLPEIITRFDGENRYDTAVKIADYAFKDAKVAFIASGENWPDALVIGPVAAKMYCPVLLTALDPVKETQAYIQGSRISKLIGLGGVKAIKDETLNQYAK